MDIGEKRITISLRTLTSVIGSFVLFSFVAGAGWISLNNKVEAAINATMPIVQIQKDLCRLNNFMIHGIKPNQFDGCE